MNKNTETRKESLLEAIWHHLVGYRYYAIISNSVGTMDINLHNRICETREEAVRVIRQCRSFDCVEVVSFFSKHRYRNVVDENGVCRNVML